MALFQAYILYAIGLLFNFLLELCLWFFLKASLLHMIFFFDMLLLHDSIYYILVVFATFLCSLIFYLGFRLFVLYKISFYVNN